MFLTYVNMKCPTCKLHKWIHHECASLLHNFTDVYKPYFSLKPTSGEIDNTSMTLPIQEGV